jgi:glutamyl-tRNA(Gln) amidotransferase subunit D
MNVYDKGRDLLKLGIISGEDMLSDTVLMKLAWLLGNYDAQKAKKLVSENLRGEINPKISEKESFEE